MQLYNLIKKETMIANSYIFTMPIGNVITKLNSFYITQSLKVKEHYAIIKFYQIRNNLKTADLATVLRVYHKGRHVQKKSKDISYIFMMY